MNTKVINAVDRLNKILPLSMNLQNLDSYEYTSKINDWLQRALENHELKRVNLK